MKSRGANREERPLLGMAGPVSFLPRLAPSFTFFSKGLDTKPKECYMMSMQERNHET